MKHLKFNQRYLSIALFLSILLMSAQVFATDYEEIDLGQSAWNGGLRAINNLNQAVGDKTVGDKTVPVLWQNGVLTELETIPSKPDVFLYYNYQKAVYINDSGDVIINAAVSKDLFDQRRTSALLLNGQMTQSPLDSLGNINNSGQIVGSSGLSAAIWENGIITDLGIYENGRSSGATKINNAGQIVGFSTAENGGNNRVILWENDQMIPLPNLSELYTYSNATDMNDSGVIVGSSRDDQNKSRPVMWKNGEIIPLGTLADGSGLGMAWAINNSGQITGSVYVESEGIQHAFIWENGVMTDLGNIGSLAGQSSVGLDINDAGYIVGCTGALLTLDPDAPFILAPVCHADANNDNIVDIKDLELKQLDFLDWLQSQEGCDLEATSRKFQELQRWTTHCWNPETSCH